MSLRVWLPLNGNLENKGISDITVTNNNVTFADNGKIGQKATTGRFDFTTIPQSQNILNAQHFSISFWAKIKAVPSGTSEGVTYIMKCGTNGTNTCLHIAIRNTGAMAFCFYSNDFTFLQSVNDYINVWTHFTFVYDSPNQIVYINGIEAGRRISSGDLTIANNSSFIFYNEPTYLNDVRIYDHCLSQKEVKELSQGLVLHYKLDGWSGGTGENLLLGSKMNYISIGTGTNYTASPVRYYNTSSSNCTVGDGQATILLNSTSNLGIAFVRLAEEIDLDTSSYYTLSCEAKCTQENAYLATGLSYYKTTDAAVWRGGTNKKAFTSTTNWQKFSLTFKPDTDTKAICYCFTVNGLSGGTEHFYLRHCKLEKGSIATPWTLSSSELGIDITKIPDSSGYGNDGTIIGNLITNEDSLRHQLSSYFNGNLRIEAPFSPPGDNTFSVSGWFKHNSGTTYYASNTTYNTYICLEEGRYFVYPASGSAFVGTYTSTANTWQHIVLVQDGVNSKLKLYINGNLVNQINSTNQLFRSEVLDLGGRQGVSQYKGNISDFRIYATALSAEDVATLYHTSAQIDDLGGVHAFDFEENIDGRELLALPWTNSYTNHTKTSLWENFNNKGEWTSNTNSSSSTDYIKITPTGNTYYYDTEISVAAGNQFYIGFERYDANKTSRSNSACVYIVAIKPTIDIVHQHYFGTVNLATDGTNPTDTITLRILNAWSGTASDSTKEATIHHLSLREIAGDPQTGKIKQQGQIYTDELVERVGQASIYENGLVGGNNFIEK